jgi:hypothetical protein
VVNQSIRAYFQPTVQLKTKRIIGFEAAPRALVQRAMKFGGNHVRCLRLSGEYRVP